MDKKAIREANIVDLMAEGVMQREGQHERSMMSGTLQEISSLLEKDLSEEAKYALDRYLQKGKNYLIPENFSGGEEGEILDAMEKHKDEQPLKDKYNYFTKQLRDFKNKGMEDSGYH